MNRSCLERSIRSAMGVSPSGVLAATVVATTLAWTAALAQQPGPVVYPHDEAPIGHQQPRIQELPPSVVQDEKKMESELDAIAKELEKLENRICRGC
jgi:hypothetical protein